MPRFISLLALATIQLACAPPPASPSEGDDPDAVTCDDGDPCTADLRDPVGICTHTAQACTSNENPCVVVTCDAAGGCDMQPSADGVACENSCGEPGTCAAGVCAAPNAGMTRLIWNGGPKGEPLNFHFDGDADGNLYWFRLDPVTFASRAPDGTTRFETEAKDYGHRALAVLGGALYARDLADEGRSLKRLAPDTGLPLWSRRAGGERGFPGAPCADVSLPVPGSEGLVVVRERDSCGGLVAVIGVAADSGATRWRAPFPGALTAHHADARGTRILVWTAGPAAQLVALGGGEGRELWRRPATAPLVTLTEEILITNDGAVFEASTGTHLLTLAGPGPSTRLEVLSAWVNGHNATIWARTLVEHESAGTSVEGVDLLSFDLRNGALRWRRPLPEASRPGCYDCTDFGTRPLVTAAGTLVVSETHTRTRACAPSCERSPDEACTWSIAGFTTELRELSLADGQEIRTCAFDSYEPPRDARLTRDAWVAAFESDWNYCDVGRSLEWGLGALSMPGISPAEKQSY